MIKDLKETEESRNILRLESAYSNGVYKLDIHDCIIVRNDNRVIIDSLSIDQVINRFYETKTVNCFGIDRAFIWDLDKHEIVRYITDLPDSEKKMKMKNHKIKNIVNEIAKLNIELQKLTDGK